jgi:hypothetical protein
MTYRYWIAYAKLGKPEQNESQKSQQQQGKKMVTVDLPKWRFPF